MCELTMSILTNKKTIEQYASDFVAKIRRIAVRTGYNHQEVFFRWVDWSFWLTMAQTRQIAEQVGQSKHVPYTIEECMDKAFSARDFLLDDGLGPVFGEMQSIWVEASLTHEEEFGVHVVANNELRGVLDKKGKGQVFTPNSLARMMSAMVGTGGGRVHDPCAGYGGLLIADFYTGGYNKKALGSRIYFAGELNTTTAKVCYLNMVCHMMPGAVTNQDSLKQPNEKIHPRWITPLGLML